MGALGAPTCDFASFVWKNRGPQPTNTKSDLKYQNLLDDSTCEAWRRGQQPPLPQQPLHFHARLALGVDTQGHDGMMWQRSGPSRALQGCSAAGQTLTPPHLLKPMETLQREDLQR